MESSLLTQAGSSLTRLLGPEGFVLRSTVAKRPTVSCSSLGVVACRSDHRRQAQLFSSFIHAITLGEEGSPSSST